jgi:hypothetical protein
MTRSATDVMQEILYAAVIDGIVALKAASKGLPNTLLRDLNAIHANTTYADLPPELQAAVQASVRTAFTKLLKDGYAVAPAGAAPPRSAAPIRREGPRPQGRPGGGHRPPGDRAPGHRPGSSDRRPPRGGPGGGGKPGRGKPGGRGPKPSGR